MILPQKVMDRSDEKRFWQNVDVRGPDECWPWKLATCRGYGRVKVGRTSLIAHRVAYFLTHRNAGDGLVCHTCDHPPCCNPRHLFLGTPKDNIQDCKRKGRLNTACGERHGSKTKPHSRARGERVGGSKLTAEQVLTIRQRFAAEESQQSLANEFGVCREAIGTVTRGIRWKHIGGPTGKSSKERHGRKGAANAQAKITEDDVRQMRRYREEDGTTYAALGRKYGVTKAQARFICKRIAWAHVTND